MCGEGVLSTRVSSRRALGGVLSAVMAVTGLTVTAQPAQAAAIPPSAPVACSPTFSTSGNLTFVTFPASSSGCTWTIPSGVTSIDAVVVGGGGGGGGGADTRAGSGGGGGQVRTLSAVSVVAGNTVTVTVGAGGSGGSAGSGGTGSATSLLVGSTTTTAGGGTGGANGTFVLNGAPVGGSSGAGFAGGNAQTNSGVNAAGGGGGSSSAATGINGGSGTTWSANGVAYGGGGGGGGFLPSPLIATPSNAKGLGTNGGGGGGFVFAVSPNTFSCNGSGAAANRGGGGGGALARTACSSGQAGAAGTVVLSYATPYTVSFLGNGGTGSMADQVSASATNLTSNAFTRSGYSFSGWATSAAGSVVYANSASYPFTSSTTLYAVWTLQTETIAYRGNGASGTTADTTGNAATTVSLRANGFTPPGSPTYTFLGWDTNPNAVAPTYVAGQSISMPAGGLTLYAIWDPPIQTSLAYDSNGGSGSISPTADYVGNTVNLSSGSGFSRSGYNLASWNSSANGSGTSYGLSGTLVMPAGGTTLYAIWTAATQTLAYDANGGSGSEASTTGATAATVSLSSGSALSRPGYSLTGWNTNSSGTGTSYALSGSLAMPAGGTTLFAVWTQLAPVTISFDANGGTGSETSITGQPTSGVNLASGSNLSLGSSTFLGWDLDRYAVSPTYQGGDSFTLSSSSQTLFAIWDPPSVTPAPAPAPAPPAPAIWTLAYDGNGGTCSTTSTRATDGTWISTPIASVCSRSGYTFTGWNTRPDGSGLNFAAGSQTQMTGDNALYAQWQAIAAPSASPAPSSSPASSPSASPSASPSVSPSASPSVMPSASPNAPSVTPSATPSSTQTSPAAAPSSSPSNGSDSGVIVLPQEGTVPPGSPSGSVDPLDGAKPSDGASFASGSIAIWDGSTWVQEYVEPGVGSWAVVNGRIIFVPVPGFTGTANSKVRVVDSAGNSDTAPVSFTVPASPSVTPSASPSKGSGRSGAIPVPPIVPGLNVLPKFGSLDSGSVAVDPIPGAQPSNGATIDPSSIKIWDGTEWVSNYSDAGVGTWSVINGKIVFVPVPGFCGTASTTYRLTDSVGSTGTGPVAALVPCASDQSGSNGSGVIPAPAPPFVSPSRLIDASPIDGAANVDGGSADVNSGVTPSEGSSLDGSSLVIWNGKSWVTSFTDPNVGRWEVKGSRIVFTPAAGFTGVARTTYRISDTAGRLGQGPISFTVVGGCSSKVFSNRVVGFTPLSAYVTPKAANSVRDFARAGCSYLVTGYVQPVGRYSNDISLSAARARVVADAMRGGNANVKVTLTAGQRLSQDACRSMENRCVIVRVMPSRQSQ